MLSTKEVVHLRKLQDHLLECKASLLHMRGQADTEIHRVETTLSSLTQALEKGDMKRLSDFGHELIKYLSVEQWDKEK